jgi:hypothetical protein
MRANILDQFDKALDELYGLVPADQRNYADDYVAVLKGCLNAMREQRDALLKIESALTYASAAIKRMEDRNEVIETQGVY